jgi:hypothetical protein
MTGTARNPLDDVLLLPEDERPEFASEIIASVDKPPDAGWTEAWLAEWHRRAQAARERAEPSPEWSEGQAEWQAAGSHSNALASLASLALVRKPS